MTHFDWSRRELGVAAALLGATMLDAKLASAEVSKLLVFLHAAVKQRALESSIRAGLSGIDVTAVGRVADFERGVKAGPDAVLSLPIVLSNYKLPVKLRGRRQGSTEETYVLVAPDRVPEPGKVATVGTLDLLGRSGTQTFVYDMLHAKPNVERVTKVEDLLPLLQMHRADAVILPARLLNSIRGSSRLKLMSYELQTRVGLPAVAALTPQGMSLVTALSKLPAEATRAIGVDEWR